MRVVIVNDYAEVNGGGAKIAIMTARGIADRGYRVTFLHGMPPVSEALQHPNITPVCLELTDVWRDHNPLGAAVRGIWSMETQRRLSGLLDGYDRADTVVHLHQWTRALSPSVIGAVDRLGFRQIVTMHDYFLRCPNGAYFQYQKDVPCSLQPMSMRCLAARCDARGSAYKSIRVIRQFATDRAVRKAGSRLNVLHVSAFSAEIAKKFLPAGIRQWVLPNPIEMQAGTRVEVRHNRHFVYVGRFKREKGCTLLAQVAFESGLPSLFMGGGPEEERIRESNPNALVFGWGTGAEVDRVLAKARALVFPSLWYETHGLVVSEALSRGVPAIVSRTTGARDVINDGVNGLLFEAGNKRDLLRCLGVFADDTQAEAMGRNAYDLFWRSPPSVETHIDSLVSIYDEMLTALHIVEHSAADVRYV
jgi:glycosyltransferase involved in cell wall biosynthesis